MRRPLILEFTKMNGAGNDFIVIDNRFYHFSDEELSSLARRLCPRRVGIGADGLLTLNEPATSDASFRMRYVNADGSLATMCGNGARCLARFARGAGMTDPELQFESDAGRFRAAFLEDDLSTVRLFFPPPEGFRADHPLAGETLPVATVHTIWTGTEHAVVLVENVDQVPVERWGPAIRRDESLMPKGANANFVEVVSSGRDGGEAVLRMRTFERGVEEETLACGTGALAAGVVTRLLEKVVGFAIRIETAGGTLRVGFSLTDGTVQDLYLEGPTETVYRGTYELYPDSLTAKR